MITYTAFERFDLLARGKLEDVTLAARKRLRQNSKASILIFSDISGKQMDLDLRGSEQDVLDRLKVFLEASPVNSTPSVGRPKLGVVSREVSLLPIHWEWLSNQAGGASAALRRLVDASMKTPVHPKQQIKQIQEAIYRFLSALAGDLPHFEEAIRYLYRKDRQKFRELIADWPKDLVKHTLHLAKPIFEKENV